MIEHYEIRHFHLFRGLCAATKGLNRSHARVEHLSTVRGARLSASEHLPAAAGTGIVNILEQALREALDELFPQRIRGMGHTAHLRR